MRAMVLTGRRPNILPYPSKEIVKPVLATRTSGIPISIARSRSSEACWNYAVVPVNQLSMVMFTNMSVPSLWRATNQGKIPS